MLNKYPTWGQEVGFGMRNKWLHLFHSYNVSPKSKSRKVTHWILIVLHDSYMGLPSTEWNKKARILSPENWAKYWKRHKEEKNSRLHIRRSGVHSKEYTNGVLVHKILNHSIIEILEGYWKSHQFFSRGLRKCCLS